MNSQKITERRQSDGNELDYTSSRNGVAYISGY